MTAHGLDAAHSCRRRFWLNHVRGWQTEPFNIQSEARVILRDGDNETTSCSVDSSI